jgi:HNH endonuclease
MSRKHKVHIYSKWEGQEIVYFSSSPLSSLGMVDLSTIHYGNVNSYYYFLVIPRNSPIREEQNQQPVKIAKQFYSCDSLKTIGDFRRVPGDFISATMKKKNWPRPCETYAQMSPDNFLNMYKKYLECKNDIGMWLFRDYLLFIEQGGEPLSEEEAALLVFESVTKREKRFQKLAQMAKLEQKMAKASRREPIPEEVRMFVWRRDEGRCVKCESQEKLEFDHIIPVSKGGANTARNLQLLCEHCNRSKSDSI